MLVVCRHWALVEVGRTVWWRPQVIRLPSTKPLWSGPLCSSLWYCPCRPAGVRVRPSSFPLHCPLLPPLMGIKGEILPRPLLGQAPPTDTRHTTTSSCSSDPLPAHWYLPSKSATNEHILLCKIKTFLKTEKTATVFFFFFHLCFFQLFAKERSWVAKARWKTMESDWWNPLEIPHLSPPGHKGNSR